MQLIMQLVVHLFASLLLMSECASALFWQAKRAVQRGATAVIFDVSENPDAIDQVCTHLELPRRSRSLYNPSPFNFFAF